MKVLIFAFYVFMSCQLQLAHASMSVDWDKLILGQDFEINREKLVMFIDNPAIG